MSCFEIDVTAPPKIEKPLILVAAAVLLDVDGRVLLYQQAEGKIAAGQWGIPGGRLEAGETPEWALVRELREELDIETRTSCFSPLTFVSHDYGKMHLLMNVFVCRVWQGVVRAVEGQSLQWVRAKEIQKIDLMPADIPLVPFIRELF